MSQPSRAVALYGTDEAVPQPRLLRAGPLTAELEAGNLRYVRWHGEEVLRAVSFIVRDKDWGTYNPAISGLTVDEDDDGFRVTLSALAGDDDQSFAYVARIEGHAEGRLVFHGTGHSARGFLTNRTGFVILHPIDGIAGAPVTIEHTDGRVVEGRFPDRIDPVQPMLDLRALTHRTPGGLRVHTLMQGDSFEMEDQRNWTDASYKTYVRPLALPWPYRIEPGQVVDQTITVTLSGQARPAVAAEAVTLRPGAVRGTMPSVGVGLRPEDADSALAALDRLADLAPGHAILHHDPRAGHDRDSLARLLRVARGMAAEPWLEAVIADPDTAGAVAEVTRLGQLADALERPFACVLVSPAPDLKCTLPGSAWPAAPDAGALYDAARAAFPGARIGGGMFSYFTELNRKPPPADRLDLVGFTTSPMVHAGDDRSVMETREAHPALVASVHAIAGATPWAVGPSAIGVRDNPYGAAAKANPHNIRQAMNHNDPRQRGLLGAAWALGYVADFAQGGAVAVALGGATGAFGVLAAPAPWPQPWYDDHGGLFPVFHVLRGLARLRGAPLRDLGLAASGPLAGLAADTGGGFEIWVANTGPAAVRVALPDAATGAVLDAARFAEAAGDPGIMDRIAPLSRTLELDGFALARILIGH